MPQGHRSDGGAGSGQELAVKAVKAVVSMGRWPGQGGARALRTWGAPHVGRTKVGFREEQRASKHLTLTWERYWGGGGLRFAVPSPLCRTQQLP